MLFFLLPGSIDKLGLDFGRRFCPHLTCLREERSYRENQSLPVCIEANHTYDNTDVLMLDLNGFGDEIVVLRDIKLVIPSAW